MPKVNKDRVKGICPVCGAKVSGQGRIYCKGCRSYAKTVRKPGHPMANEAGYVAEHRLIAEQKLGRPLRPGEVVHRLDGDKNNNDPDNLMVFASTGDLVRHTARQRRRTWAAELERITREHWLDCWHALDKGNWEVRDYLIEQGYSRRASTLAADIIGPLHVKEIKREYWRRYPRNDEMLQEIAKEKEPLLFEAVRKKIEELKA